jgi:hypothetical protein
VKALLVAAMFAALSLAAVPAGRAQAPPPAAAARGTAAAAHCESMSWSMEDYSGCIDGAVAHAMDNDRASTAFQLGVYCTAFYKLAQAYDTQMWKQTIVDRNEIEVTTVDQFGSCLYAARTMRLASSQICTTVGADCAAFDPLIERWKKISDKDM